MHVMNELIDEACGRILTCLRTLGLSENTDVVFTTDQGEIHAVRLLAFVIVVPPLLHAAQRRRHRKRGRREAPHLSVLRAAFAKCCLVAAAIPATVLLRPYTSHADLVVGTGIAAAVALAGPRVHATYLIRPPTGASGTTGPSGRAVTHGQHPGR